MTFRPDSELLAQTVIAVATRGDMAVEAVQSILSAGAAKTVITAGISDTALARNVQISRAYKAAMGSVADTVLLLDDDIRLPKASMARLVREADEKGRPVSALYVDAMGNVCCSPWASQGMLCGLGALAVPLECLAELVPSLSTFVASSGEEVWEWTESRLSYVDGTLRWLSEDYSFCRLLGGAVVLPDVQAGHVKPVPLMPSQEAIHLAREWSSKDTS